LRGHDRERGWNVGRFTESDALLKHRDGFVDVAFTEMDQADAELRVHDRIG
jgi:hypothetical protein